MKLPGSLKYESLLSARRFMQALEQTRCGRINRRTERRDFSSRFFLKQSIDLFKNKYQIESFETFPFVAVLQKRSLHTASATSVPEAIIQMTGDSAQSLSHFEANSKSKAFPNSISISGARRTIEKPPIRALISISNSSIPSISKSAPSSMGSSRVSTTIWTRRSLRAKSTNWSTSCTRSTGSTRTRSNWPCSSISKTSCTGRFTRSSVGKRLTSVFYDNQFGIDRLSTLEITGESITNNHWSVAKIILISLVMFNALILLILSLSTCISLKCFNKNRKPEEAVVYKVTFKLGRLQVFWFGLELFSVLLFFLELFIISMLAKDIKLFFDLSSM